MLNQAYAGAAAAAPPEGWAGTGGGAGAGTAVDYLVDCHYFPETDSLQLLAGDWEGGGILCNVTDTAITPLRNLKGGHRAGIRTCSWSHSGPSKGTLVTGGEDTRLCTWDPSRDREPVQTGGGTGRAGMGGRAGKGGRAGPQRSAQHEDRSLLQSASAAAAVALK